MSDRRWKSQSLQLHAYVTGPQSKAMRHGLLPRYVHLTMLIAMAAGRLAGFAKKAWRDDKVTKMDLEKVRSLRAEMNAAFDHLESLIAQPGFETISAIDPEAAGQAHKTFAERGNFAMLGIALMEESAELAEPLLALASGQVPLSKVRKEIEAETADVRTYLHIASEQASVCAETSTGAKWAKVRDRFPKEAFELPKGAAPQDISSAIKGLVSPRRKKAA